MDKYNKNSLRTLTYQKVLECGLHCLFEKMQAAALAFFLLFQFLLYNGRVEGIYNCEKGFRHAKIFERLETYWWSSFSI